LGGFPSNFGGEFKPLPPFLRGSLLKHPTWVGYTHSGANTGIKPTQKPSPKGLAQKFIKVPLAFPKPIPNLGANFQAFISRPHIGWGLGPIWGVGGPFNQILTPNNTAIQILAFKGNPHSGIIWANIQHTAHLPTPNTFHPPFHPIPHMVINHIGAHHFHSFPWHCPGGRRLFLSKTGHSQLWVPFSHPFLIHIPLLVGLQQQAIGSPQRPKTFQGSPQANIFKPIHFISLQFICKVQGLIFNSFNLPIGC